MKKRGMALILAAALMLGFTGCTTEEVTVPVVSVGMLTGAGTAAEKYAGEVVSERVTEVQRDTALDIGELCVQEGDRVKAGDVLFSYDTDLLELDLERAKLELEQMRAAVSTFTTQIQELQTLIKSTKDQTEKMGYEIRLQELQVDKQTKEYEIDVKEKEIAYDQSVLKNVKVTSPVDGRIRSVDEDGYDDYGNAVAYITIQQTGAYRIQATVNELNLLSPDCGVVVGAKVRVVSRVDSAKSWTGTITLIDTDSIQTQSGTAAAGYPFYVEVEDTTGLILGQHVYVEILTGMEREGIWMPEGYLMDVTTASQSDGSVVTTAWVWAADEEGCLQRRTVQLGGYDETLGAYEILGGLTAQDYVADPANEKCAEGVYVEYRSSADFADAPAAETATPSDGTDTTGGTVSGSEPAQTTAATEPEKTPQNNSSSGGDLNVVTPVTEQPQSGTSSDGDLQQDNWTGMPGEKGGNGEEMARANWEGRL